MDQDVKYWVDLSKHDIKTAKAMLESGRYLYVLFTCQQSIEKMLKALLLKTQSRFLRKFMTCSNSLTLPKLILILNKKNSSQN